MTDWKDILAGNDEPLSEEDLLRYLDHRLSDEDRQTIETDASSSFEQDALQGLQQVKNTERVQKHVKQLKQSLKQQLDNKKNKRAKKNIDVMQWIIYVILLLLITCVVSYVIIKMQQNRTPKDKGSIEQKKP
jgi:Flp pilus assembly protein TadB